LKNSLINPQVRIEFDNSTYSGTASLVRDQLLASKISSIKYSDVEKAKESRIVLQVIIDKK